jgi:hypothetical protein
MQLLCCIPFATLILSETLLLCKFACMAFMKVLSRSLQERLLDLDRALKPQI